MKAFVVVDVVVLLVLGLWLTQREGDERANVVNDGLRGSTPPAGQVLPDLREIPGITPAPPSPAALEGDAVAILATCLQCRSGGIIGGFLGRLERDDVPRGARVLVVGWGGDVEEWRDRWRVGVGDDAPDIEMFATAEAAGTAAARTTFRIGPGPRGEEESGIAFLHDREGTWRSSFYVGQLHPDDLRHDLEQLQD